MMHGDAEKYMLHALNLARQNLGLTSPSPSVGCVIVRNGEIIGTGITQAKGRPHAEFMAIQMAGDIKGADVFVTLEPCAHESVRGPCCTELLLNAAPARVFIAMTDPDNRTKGQGIAKLKAAGIEIITPLCEAEAIEVNKGFINWIETGQPILEIAQNGASYDAKLEIFADESLEAALNRHGSMGHTRIWWHGK